jgi:citrate lyase subunit beta/citryl-CoA lyase
MDDSMRQRCASARSLLFVPGNRPERFEKAAASGADLLVLDLEDSVPAGAKAAAREAIGAALPGLAVHGIPLVIRMNPPDTEDGQADLAWLRKCSVLDAVMLPKAESVSAIARVHRALRDIGVLPIIESAAGYRALPDLATAPGVIRLVIGHIDFMADTGVQCDELESQLAPLRFAVAMATRQGALAPAVDGVTVQINDDERLRADTLRAQRFGFGGKLCIHPRQVAVVHAALAPTPEQLDWARRVVAADAAAGGAAVQLDGRMVDVPVVLQARRTLANAGPAGCVDTLSNNNA